MTINLIDRVRDQLTPDVIAGIADGAAESTDTARNALHTIMPALLGAVVRFARAPTGGTRLLRLIREGGYDGYDYTELVGQMSSPHARTQLKLEGSRLLDRVLGEKRLEVTEQLGRATGLSAPTTGRFMSLGIPVVMGAIGSAVTAQDLDAPALVDLLAAQEPALSRAMPPSVSPLVAGIEPHPEAAPLEPERARASRVPAWFFAAALALLALFMIPQLFPGKGDPFRESELTQPGSTMNYGEREEAAAREAEGVEDTKQKAEPGRAADPSAEATEASVDEIERYLESDDEDMRRFALSELRFDAGESALSEAAEAQLDRLAGVIEKHPKVVVMVTGHADARGDAAENRELATARARVVGERLVKRGIEARRVRVLSAGETAAEGSADEASGRVVEISLVKGDVRATTRGPRY
jgi:outer membrane protein OmpA-like peptidoglycan-associated protein